MHHRTGTGQPGDQTKSEWVYERQILSDQADFLYDQVTHLVDVGKAVDIVYLDFREAMYTASHSLFLEKLSGHGLQRYIVG